MLTNSGLVEYCLKCLKLKTAYMWGSFGQKVTSDFIKGRIRQYPDRYSDRRVQYLNGMIGGYGFDCVGLIKSYIWGGYGNLRYNPKQDLNCTGMLALSKKKGKINTLPEIPGLAVYKKGHIGVYIGNGEVIEATLSSDWKYDGVERTPLNHQKWTDWLQIPFIEDDSKTSAIKEKVSEIIDKANQIVKNPPSFDDVVKPRSLADIARLNKTKDRL